MRARSAILVLFAFAFAFAACGEMQTGPQAEPRGAEVTIEHIAFTPETLQVEVGETVTWTNKDAEVKHTITSGRPGDAGVPGLDNAKPDRPDGTFDGEVADEGDTFTFTFDQAGTFRYFCRVHPVMTARVTVSD